MTTARRRTTPFSFAADELDVDEAGHIAITVAVVMTESGGSTPASTRPATTHGYNTFGDEAETQILQALYSPCTTRTPGGVHDVAQLHAAGFVDAYLAGYGIHQNDLGQGHQGQRIRRCTTCPTCTTRTATLPSRSTQGCGKVHNTYNLNGERLSATN